MLRQSGWVAGGLGGWLAGCPSHAGIKTAKPSYFFSTVWYSPIILVSSDPCDDTQFQLPRGTPSAGALNTRGWEKLAIFDGNRRLSRKRFLGRWLLWNVNRKSWVPDRIVSFSMTLVTPNPGFRVTVCFQVEYLKTGAFRDKVTIEH